MANNETSEFIDTGGILVKRVYDGFHKIDLINKKVKGVVVEREKLGLKSAVGALVIDSQNRMALVHQFRPAIKEMTYEIPAGLLDKHNLSPVQTILEELEEECEIKQSDILYFDSEPFTTYYMVVGSSDSQLSIYHMRVTEQVDKMVNDTDVESVQWKTLREVNEMVKKGIINDPKTLLAIHEFKHQITF